MLKKSLQILNFLSIAYIALNGCAKVGMPTGGARDIEPPVVIEESTPNYSTNFNEDRFEIFFNEFVQLKNAQNNVIVNPPLENKPEFILKGKSILVKINNDLEPDKTYSFDFGKAIVDNNEANPLGKYSYVFSTGDYIDSLSVFGEVKNAFDHKIPEEEVLILLHKNLNDTAFTTIKPSYYTKIDKTGSFQINNTEPGTYNIFALEDKNSDLIYDQKFVERIAFKNEPVTIGNKNYFEQDTIIERIDKYMEINNISSIDSIEMGNLVKDSTIIDSVKNKIKEQERMAMYLEISKEEKKFDEIKRTLKSFKRPEEHKFLLIFNKKTINPEIEIIKPEEYAGKDIFITDINPISDTFSFYLKDTNLIKEDNFTISAKYNSKDSLQTFISKTDTLPLSKKISRNFILPKPGISTEVSTALDLGKDLTLKLNTPVEFWDTSYINLFNIINDSTKKKINYSYKVNKLTDSIFIDKLTLNKNNFSPNQKYEITVLPGAFENIYYKKNDTLNIRFTTKKLEDYGRIMLTLKNVKNNSILTLINNSEETLKEFYIKNDTTIDIKYLPPSFYSFKIYVDNNNNKKWDPCDYDQMKQAEPAIYFNSEINLRANWDVEHIWNLEKVYK